MTSESYNICKDCQQIDTIGTKDTKVGCTGISDNHCNIMCIPEGDSIFMAKAKGVDLALDFKRTCGV